MKVDANNPVKLLIPASRELLVLLLEEWLLQRTHSEFSTYYNKKTSLCWTRDISRDE